jgi:hypothetical protein
MMARSSNNWQTKSIIKMQKISPINKFKQYAPYFFLLIILISSLRMFPEFWDKNFYSISGKITENPIISGDYPVWTVYAQKNSSVKILDFWPFEVPVLTFFAGRGPGAAYSTPLILPFLLAKVFNASLSVKLCYLLTLVLIFHSVFLICLKFSSKSIAAFTGFICVQLVATNPEIKMGMWYNFMSISFSAYFVFWWDRYLTEPSKSYFLFSLFFWMLSIYTHPLGNIACGLYWLATLSIYRTKLSVHIAILGFVCLLGSPQLMQTLRNTGVSGENIEVTVATALTIDSWSVLLKKIIYPLKMWVDNTLVWMNFYEPSLSWTYRLRYIFLPFLLLGVLHNIKRYKDKSRLIVLIFSLYLYIFATGIIQSIFSKFSFMVALLTFQSRLTLIFHIPFAIIFSSSIQEWFSNKQYSQFSITSLISQTGRVLIVIIIILSLAEIIFTRHGTIVTENDITNDERGKWGGMVDFLNDSNNGLDTDQYRVFVTNHYFMGDKMRNGFGYAHAHIAALGALHSNVQLIGAAWGGPYVSGELLGLNLDELSEDAIEEKARRLNIRYFLIKNEQVKSVLNRMDDMIFHRDLGVYRLFELKSHENGWAYGKTTHEVLPHTEWEQRSAVFNIPYTFNDSTIIISRSYSRNFKVYLNDLPLKVTPWEQLIEIHLPSGNHGGKQLSLKFRPLDY